MDKENIIAQSVNKFSSYVESMNHPVDIVQLGEDFYMKSQSMSVSFEE